MINQAAVFLVVQGTTHLLWKTKLVCTHKTLWGVKISKMSFELLAKFVMCCWPTPLTLGKQFHKPFYDRLSTSINALWLSGIFSYWLNHILSSINCQNFSHPSGPHASLLAPKVLLEYLGPMIIIHPIHPSVRHIALNELNRPKIDQSQPKMT